jgi:tetratricopeptide (TPR) repeat protein
MDNAKDAAQMKPLIPPPGCAFLVTSRQHFTFPGLQARNLDTLPPPDAKALLLRIAPRIDREAEAIAKLCGYLPQALRLAASALAVRADLEPPDYTKQLADEKRRLELLAADDESVEASINLSYGLLNRKTQKRWRMLAVFPDTFDARAAAAVWQVEADTAQNTLGRLIQHSMLEWNDTAKRYRLHDLMRDFASGRLEPSERDEAARLHAGHYLTVLGIADDLYLKGGELLMRGLALFDAERGNVQAGQTWAAARAAESPEAARLCNGYPSAGAYCLDLRQHPRDRIQWLETGLLAARQLKDRAAEGAHLGNLGKPYYYLGETPRAIEYYEQQLVISRELGDRQAEGNALCNLGNIYAISGETPRATEYYEQQLVISRELGDRRGEGDALGNLGIAYRKLNETPRAIEYHEQALAIDLEIGNRRGEGQDLFNMSLVLNQLGSRKEAIENAQAALKIFEEIEDPNAEKVRKQLEHWRKG